MAVTLQKWIEEEVSKVKDKSIRWLSEYYFNRVESRPTPIDFKYMFTPADGVIIGAWENLGASEKIIDIKGIPYTLRDLMDDDSLEGEYCVVSVFMTFYSQHQNYIPYAGIRDYSELPPITTNNKPMLAIEKELMKGVVNPQFQEDYLGYNGREINTFYSPKLKQEYFVVRIADYDVNNIVSWEPEKLSYQQNECFGMIKYGSQCVLIAKQGEGVDYKLRKEAKVGNYVKCREDALIEIF